LFLRDGFLDISGMKTGQGLKSRFLPHCPSSLGLSLRVPQLLSHWEKGSLKSVRDSKVIGSKLRKLT
jgi:hypothetical protein